MDNSKTAEEQARLSAVALMYEVMRTDGEHNTDKLEALIQNLALRWQLDADEAKTLLTSACEKVEQAVAGAGIFTSSREQKYIHLTTAWRKKAKFSNKIRISSARQLLCSYS